MTSLPAAPLSEQHAIRAEVRASNRAQIAAYRRRLLRLVVSR